MNHADYKRPIANEDRINLAMIQRYDDANVAQIADFISEDPQMMDDVIAWAEFEGASEEEITDLVERIDARIS